jgi:AraC-like DNA-binding protein
MCVRAPRGPLPSVYRPLICLILQGSKKLFVGSQERVVSGGESVIVRTDMPVVGRIVQASPSEPYLAMAVELDVALIKELVAELGSKAQSQAETTPMLVTNVDDAALDCGVRLMRLLDRPEAIPILQPGIMRELHYWLLSGPHGPALQSLGLPFSNASRLAAAIAILRAEYRSRISVSRLAKAAGMSQTAFHVHFKQLTSLTPIQFQKNLRLIEARRLMLQEGQTATRAAFDVGYESANQFTREYARLFGAPPKRDTIRARTGPAAVVSRASAQALARQ